MNLTLDERKKIFDKVCRLVETKHFNPAMNGVDWNALVQSRRDQILACDGAEAFEKEVHRLVVELKTSHTGFRHAGMRNIPARHAINATLQRFAVNGTERWMFQDVHRGGPAYLAGIRPGDLLLGTGEREIRPPEDLTFSAGGSAELAIEKLHGDVEWVKLRLPTPKSKKHPVTAPDAVHAELLTDEIGLLKVAMFPGAIGIDVAKDIDRGIAALHGCSRLIVDLRGNTGGGIGGLRLMSYLRPRGQVHSRSYRGTGPSSVPRARCPNGERAYRQCRRNGGRICRGEQTGKDRRNQDTRSFAKRRRFQGRSRLHFGIASCWVSDLAGQDVGKQRHHSRCFC